MCLTCRCVVSQALMTSCDNMWHVNNMHNKIQYSTHISQSLKSHSYIFGMPTTNCFLKILARPPGPTGVRTGGSSGHPQWVSLELTLKYVEVRYYVIRTPMICWAHNSIRVGHTDLWQRGHSLTQCRFACRTHEFKILHLMKCFLVSCAVSPCYLS